ncbi:hypothetical protein P9112_011888 [Eukaryota sp. TZLM1-RC]
MEFVEDTSKRKHSSAALETDGITPELKLLLSTECTREEIYAYYRIVFFDLESFQHQVKIGKCKNARLIALKKNESKIRPIAIGESLSRILASAVFGRIGKKAKDFLSPFQFGIKTVDGASSAALSSDVFFNSNTSNYILNLDFKNAFNAVKRSSILPLLQTHFPEAVVLLQFLWLTVDSCL